MNLQIRQLALYKDDEWWSLLWYLIFCPERCHHIGLNASFGCVLDSIMASLSRRLTSSELRLKSIKLYCRPTALLRRAPPTDFAVVQCYSVGVWNTNSTVALYRIPSLWLCTIFLISKNIARKWRHNFALACCYHSTNVKTWRSYVEIKLEKLRLPYIST